MDLLPSEVIIEGIIPNLSLGDVISLRGTCQTLRKIIDDKEVLRYLRIRVFEDNTMARRFWNLIIKSPGYNFKALVQFLQNGPFDVVIKYLQLSLPVLKLELKEHYDNCHYFHIGSPCYFPCGLFKDGKIIMHQDGRRVIYLGEKAPLLQQLYDEKKSPEFVFVRSILPYYIGIDEDEVVEYWKWRKVHIERFENDLIPIEYRGEPRLSYPELVENNYWSLTYPRAKLCAKWNFAMEKFQRGFLPVKAISIKLGKVFSGKLMFSAEDDDKIGERIIEIMGYGECDTISYYFDEKTRIKRLDTARKRKAIICDEEF